MPEKIRWKFFPHLYPPKIRLIPLGHLDLYSQLDFSFVLKLS